MQERTLPITQQCHSNDQGCLGEPHYPTAHWNLISIDQTIHLHHWGIALNSWMSPDALWIKRLQHGPQPGPVQLLPGSNPSSMAPCPVLLLSGWTSSSWSVQSSSSLSFLISHTCTTDPCQASLLSIVSQVRKHTHSQIQLARHLSKDTTVTGAWVYWNFLWWIIYLTHFCRHLVMKKYNFKLTKTSFKLVSKSSK